MADIFGDNPLVHDFVLTNNSSEHINLTEGSVNIPPGASGSLATFSVDFCRLKYKYTYQPLVRQWFDSGKLSATPVNGTAPIVCAWEPVEGSGGSGTGEIDFGRVRITATDAGTDYLENKVIVDATTMTKQVVNESGYQRLFLAGTITEFTDLHDTPSNYTNVSERVVRVKNDETGLEFKKWKHEEDFGALLIWPVMHNLGYEPLFEVVDSVGRPRHFIDYENVSLNRIDIKWNEPTAGKIRLR